MGFAGTFVGEEIVQIDYFKEFAELARCESISQAARKLYMTHQTLSPTLRLWSKSSGTI